jgi:F-type H+/Na+-transporting ATPase subunit alpha
MEETRLTSKIKNFGKVLSVKDGVIELDGLSNVGIMEKIYCQEKDIYALVLNLLEETVGAVILGDDSVVVQGDMFVSTGEMMAIKADENLLGRVVNALGEPLDGRELKNDNSKQMPIERKAYTVFDRKPVDTPLKTGILAVDAMVPIGRGQRQLIIGDRGTGKTSLAISAIINQKDEQKRVVCIYCAIGQKDSTVKNIVEILKENGCMHYSIVVDASASAPAALQYLAPYSAVAIGEYFLEKGEDVLIIYDDLTKHAYSYRHISLILRRPPGREAYPGDIFYLHSRLLERSCRLNDKVGGGSITAFPIIETQFGDVSAYIPTNVISITDGQIFLDKDMFNSGFRPAVDPTNSVSRVGGAAQTKELKKASGKLRLTLTQFKELEAFTQFGGEDLDDATKEKIKRGQVIMQMLKQPQYDVMSEPDQLRTIQRMYD